ncbi:DUF2065 domain-containing protein [Marinicaulis flavus]|uniref:DUF2065 domain-containing protein n=1 Tax=Hyphococcus luteus TaxID=2058213 RepID=A0A2S7K8L8_9PROT|nr:DUF2065 domain-containing protein [Marinicaulis flavus]
MTTSTVLTLSLAKAMGFYFIAGGLSGFISRTRWAAILDEFIARPALTFISGVFVFVLGAALIMAHNIWTDPLAIAVTLIGWAAAIEGIVLVAYPDPLLRWAVKFVRPGAVRAFSVFTILLGAVFLALGFTGRAGL